MTRKRIQKKQIKKPKQQAKKIITKPKTSKRNLWIIIILISISCLVLFFNGYFNHISGIAINPDGTTLGTKYYLSGPDPYYNMRLCQITMDTGQYPFVALSDGDPLLNYPVGVYAGARPPLFNMLAVGTASFLGNFMPTMDALGMAMLWLPAIYGALLIFPVYGIGKELFNKKAGLIAAFFVAIIPIHIGSGHGSSYALFDHDSFVLLLFTFAFFFIIKLLKEKDIKKSIAYTIFLGVTIGAIEMTWVASQVLYVLITAYLIVQFVFDIFTGIKKEKVQKSGLLTMALLLGYAITLPYTITSGRGFTFLFTMFGACLGITALYIILYKLKTPWIISVPIMGVIGGLGMGFLYAVNQGIITMIGPIKNLANVIFGSGIYGSKVSLTIGEAHTYGISQTVLSFGPALYWIALAGFILFLYKTHRQKYRPANLFFITLFIVQLWMTTVAGRFLNDLIPAVAVFSGFTIYLLVEKIDYKQMISNIKSIGGFDGLKRGIKISHIAGILFIAFIVIMPNTYLALDSAVPVNLKEDIFGEEHSAAYGLSLGQQIYWVDACYWLSQQDTEIENPGDRPGILTWWDYGFYLSSMSGHPTVADNYQEGIEPAGNFHTATSEKEAVSVLIIRLTEGTKVPKARLVGDIPIEVEEVFDIYLPNESNDIVNILEDPETYAPSYNKPVAPEWGNQMLKVSAENAMYHDITNILMNLSDKELTKLHHDIIKVTGTEIRYYGIEQRDMRTIFGVFPFLSDKSTHGYTTLEDDWFRTIYVDKNTGRVYTEDELSNLTDEEKSKVDIGTQTQRKDNYFNSIAYRTFFGIREGNALPDNRVPTYLLKHWKPVYISPYISIAKYYEGANITGTVKIGDLDYNGATVYLLDENGIPHDSDIVENGIFKLLGLAGENRISLYMQDKELDMISIGNISEAEAMWEESSNYTASFNINYSNLDLSVTGLNETAYLNITGVNYPSIEIVQQVYNDNYSFSNLIPAYYIIELKNETGFSLYEQEIFLQPNNNEYKISLE